MQVVRLILRLLLHKLGLLHFAVGKRPVNKARTGNYRIPGAIAQELMKLIGNSHTSSPFSRHHIEIQRNILSTFLLASGMKNYTYFFYISGYRGIYFGKFYFDMSGH